MLVNLTIRELKIISKSLPVSDKEEIQVLQDKIDKKIEYYDFASQDE